MLHTLLAPLTEENDKNWCSKPKCRTPRWAAKGIWNHPEQKSNWHSSETHFTAPPQREGIQAKPAIVRARSKTDQLQGIHFLQNKWTGSHMDCHFTGHAGSFYPRRHRWAICNDRLWNPKEPAQLQEQVQWHKTHVHRQLWRTRRIYLSWKQTSRTPRHFCWKLNTLQNFQRERCKERVKPQDKHYSSTRLKQACLRSVVKNSTTWSSSKRNTMETGLRICIQHPRWKQA